MSEDYWRTQFFSSLALIEFSTEPIMAFDDFLSFEFTKEKQAECLEKWIFNDTEMKYLLYIYILMNDLYLDKKRLALEKKIDIWHDWSLNEEQTVEIKKLIVSFLSLKSMSEDMKIIRKNSNYKWVLDFY